MDDKDLLKGCLEKDEAAWKEFMTRFSRLIYNYLINTLNYHAVPHTREDIEDLFCSLMAHLVEKDYKVLRAFTWRCSLATWLRLITTRWTIDRIRTNMKPRKIVSWEDSARDELFDAEAGHDFSDDQQESFLKDMFESLNPKEQLFFKLYYENGAPIPQIAKLLRMTESGVYSIKSRLVEKAKEQAALLPSA